MEVQHPTRMPKSFADIWSSQKMQVVGLVHAPAEYFNQAMKLAMAWTRTSFRVSDCREVILQDLYTDGPRSRRRATIRNSSAAKVSDYRDPNQTVILSTSPPSRFLGAFEETS